MHHLARAQADSLLNFAQIAGTIGGSAPKCA
jgi:hypothetical protein